MATKLFILSALALLMVVAGRVTRDAPKEDFFGDLFDNVSHFFDDAHQTFLKAAGAESDADLEKKAIDQGKAYSKKLDVWATDIKTQTESLKDNESIKKLRESVDKNIEEFKLNNPVTTADVQAFADKAQKGADEILTKLKSLTNSEEAKNIKDLFKEIGEKSIDTFKNLPNSLKD